MLKRIALLLGIALIVSVSACSSTGKDTGYYKSKTKTKTDKPLEVPPELTRPERSDSLSVPVIFTEDATYSQNQADSTRVKRDRGLLPDTPGGRLKQDGDIRWLEVDASPEEVWREAQGFFRSLGFEIKQQVPKLGIFQTSMQKSEVYLPTNWFIKVLNKLSSSGYMDKYRVRIERTDDPHKTRMYITHQGWEEVAINEDDATSVVDTFWQPRPSDPELEVEMMLRFLAFRGMDEEQVEQARKNKPKHEDRAVIEELDGEKTLVVLENFPRTWRRTGLAIDRLGIELEDRNRDEGLYYIRLSEDFLKNHASKSKDKTVQFKIQVNERDGESLIIIRDMDGNRARGKNAEVLLEQLFKLLR